MKRDHRMLLQQKIEAGCALILQKTILHTAPHHDDIVLSYHAYVVRNLAGNNNHVVYATSGSHGVSDQFIVKVVRPIDQAIIAAARQLSYQQVLQEFVRAYHSQNSEQMLMCSMYMMVQFVAEIFACCDHDAIERRLHWLLVVCSSNKQSVQDIELVQELKGRIRESESDRKWMLCKGNIEQIEHFRASFYHADEHIFADAMESDIQRFVKYVDTIQPDIITVALDPQDIGPKNHFTTLQLIAAALERSQHENIEILGYRNIWSNFEVQDVSMIIPVTQSELNAMKSVFLNCFATQKTTLFFGTDIDGTFVDQAEQIQKIQWRQVQASLKQDCDQQKLADVQDAVGAIFLKKLTIDELVWIARGMHT